VDLDLVIKNGTVIDGTGRPRFRADLGLSGGRIVALGNNGTLAGRASLDATGLVVAPGFIDIHSHSDWILPLPDHHEILAPLVLQGVTTLVTGHCGLSLAPVTLASIPLVDGASAIARDRTFPYRWRSMAEFLQSLQGDGLLLNVACLVGHGTLRQAVMSNRSDAPSPDEMEALRRLTRQALREGAFGFSAGLAYVPGIFARNGELQALLQVVADEGGIFAVHGRAYTWVSPFYQPLILGTAHNIRSVRELIELARASGVRLQLSHQIFVGRRTWRTHRTVLRQIERAAGDGLDLAFDAFPYTFGNTSVNAVFPEWFLDGFYAKIQDPAVLRRLKREMDLLRWTLGLNYEDIRLLWGCTSELAELEGLDFGTIARRLGLPTFDAYIHVARQSGGNARILLGTYSGDGTQDAPLQATLSHPLCAFMTDTFLTSRGTHNPASFGTFPRILGRYSRDLELFSLEEAVRRMTSFSADRTGLSGVGRIAEGSWADLVLFDPQTVADRTTLEHADASPEGIRAVLIGGHVVAQDGEMLPGQRHGRVLRR
jgi:N-acyl-D-amino-acid deacylase